MLAGSVAEIKINCHMATLTANRPNYLMQGSVWAQKKPLVAKLSFDMLETENPEKAVAYIESIYNSKQYSFDQIFDAFRHFSISKTARLFLIMKDISLRNRLFKRMDINDKQRALQVLLALNPAPYDSGAAEDKAWLTIDSLLSTLDPSRRSSLRALIDEQYNHTLETFLNETILNDEPVFSGIINDHPDATEIFMGQYAISQANSQKPILQSSGATACVIVVLWDSESKLGAMAHMSPSNLVYQSLDIIFKKMREHGVKDSSKYETYILGGNPRLSHDVLGDIVDRLQEEGIQEIKIEEPRGTTSIHGSSAMLDTRTGELFPYNETIRTTPQDRINIIINNHVPFSVLQPHRDSM